MKISKLFLPLAIAFAGIIFTSTSCSKDSVSSNTSQSATDGNWRLSLYFDNSDETNKFSGYIFSFNSNGQVSATNGTNTVAGTWSQTSSKFILDFGATALFSDLNDDWLIEEKTAAAIKVKDDNPARNEKLQFIKL